MVESEIKENEIQTKDKSSHKKKKQKNENRNSPAKKLNSKQIKAFLRNQVAQASSYISPLTYTWRILQYFFIKSSFAINITTNI